MCMIYKYEDNPEKTAEKYEREIRSFAQYLALETAKGKKPLIITGSGISSSEPSYVPTMGDMMKKIEDLVESSDIRSYSGTFQKIYSEYKTEKEANGPELHTLQSRLLTYIQYAYLDEKIRYIQQEDVKRLEKLWTDFIIWLLRGEGTQERPGILNAKASENHIKIMEMYKEMRAFSITTNFDNLLKDAFDAVTEDSVSENVEKDELTPILEKEDFEKYFTSGERDNNFVEIQSRGDVFWVKCTGKQNRVCPNIAKKCYIPGSSLSDDAEHITCRICGSPAKVYFAFPGTKEKDAEMAQVMSGVWKFLAYKVSAIIITGNSMDYDPVLNQFVQEMILRRGVKVFYISRYKRDEGETAGIEKKAATRFLFRNPGLNEVIWCRTDPTEAVLSDLLEAYKEVNCNLDCGNIAGDEKSREMRIYLDEIKECIGQTENEAFCSAINRMAGFEYCKWRTETVGSAEPNGCDA